MKRILLSTSALTSIVLLSTVTIAQAVPHSGSTTGFVASANAGTTNAIGPELQLQEQRNRDAIVRPHLDAVILRQQLGNGQAPAGYAGGF